MNSTQLSKILQDCTILTEKNILFFFFTLHHQKEGDVYKFYYITEFINTKVFKLKIKLMAITENPVLLPVKIMGGKIFNKMNNNNRIEVYKSESRAKTFRDIHVVCGQLLLA